MITDLQYLNFLHALLDDQHGENGLALSGWEMDFLGSFNNANRTARWITAGRRRSIDAMWRRYGTDLHHPHPMDPAAERPRIADADPDGCEYLVRDGGSGTGQYRCNSPAEFEAPGKLRYCQTHAEAVEQSMKRRGKRIALVKFHPAA